jgi:hypothetical protein
MCVRLETKWEPDWYIAPVRYVCPSPGNCAAAPGSAALGLCGLCGFVAALALVAPKRSQLAKALAGSATPRLPASTGSISGSGALLRADAEASLKPVSYYSLYFINEFLRV